MSKWAIDLGTTNTCITRWNETLNQPEIIKMNNISRINANADARLEIPTVVPSCIYILPENRVKAKIDTIPFFAKNFFIGNLGLIGMEAINKNVNIRRPNFVKSFKQQLIYNPFQVIARTYNKEYTSSQVAFIFMRELLNQVKNKTGERPKNMVFTTPVDSYENYRYQLKEIAKRLGIEQTKVLDEPVAAAIGYGLNITKEKLVLVFDYGGGTLDIALVKLSPKTLESGESVVIAKEGLQVGGNIVDAWILEEFFKRTGYDLRDKMDNSSISIWYRIMLDEACRVKESLYLKSKEKFLIDPPEYLRNLNLVLGKNLDKLTEFTKEDLIDILTKNNLYNIINDTIEKIMINAKKFGISAKDVNEVLMVGGSSLLPNIYLIFENKFGRDKIRAWQPFEAVAYGACIYAADKFINNDFVTHNYSFVTYDKKKLTSQYNIIIPEGTKFPTSKNFWKKKVIPSCLLGDPEKTFKLVICEMGLKKNSRAFIWDEQGKMEVLNSDTKEPLIIPLNESNPTLGILDPPHSPSDKTPRLEVSFWVNEDKWLCANVFDLKTKKNIMVDEPVVRLQ